MADFGTWIAVGLGAWTVFAIIVALVFYNLDKPNSDSLGKMIVAFIIAKVLFIIGMCGWLFYGTYLIWN